MLTYKFKRTLLQIIPFGLISTIFSVLYILLEKGILGENPIYPSTGNPYSFELFIPSVISFIIGLSIGVFEVLFLSKLFQGRSLNHKIFFKIIIYLLIITAAILVLVIVSNSTKLGVGPFNQQIWPQLLTFISDFAFWSILLYFSAGIIICLLYNEISDNIGQVVLLNFFSGKYHRPIEEERIFMFLDMKSSTAIAEQLGHIRYFEMLNEYYKNLSEAIILYGGEIYQYVGDEIVITWKIKTGVVNNCLSCFFAMKKTLNQRTAKYLSEYGVLPTFKAGIHFGMVTTGEIGTIKKDIIHSGDVLNTTARIQQLCNKYEVELLVSEKIIGAITTNGVFQPIKIGESKLRGRNEKVSLYTIKQIG